MNHEWFNPSRGRGQSRGSDQRRRARSPSLEGLEDRRLLAGASAAVPVSIEVARVSDLDGNGVVSGSRAVVVGSADPGAVVRIDLDGDGDFDRFQRAGGLGRFAFVAALDPGLNEVAVEARLRDGSISTADRTLGLPARTFSSFAEAADEGGISRIYGGLHFPFDNTEGLANGRAIGRYVVENFPV